MAINTFYILPNDRGWLRRNSLVKDPSDVITVDLDFNGILGADTISAATVGGVNITIDSSPNAGNIVTMTLSGGSSGTVAQVKTTMTSTAGLVLERSFNVEIEEL